MLVLKLRPTKIRAWRGYTRIRRIEDGKPFLPKRMTWLEEEASLALEKMGDACDHLMEVTDGYRSTMSQIKAIKEQVKKRRLFAPPTKSGHGFGWSIDVKIKETLQNFRKSKKSEIVSAGRDRASLVRWMKQFGWTGIKSESWHFNFLGGHGSTVKKIEALFGEDFKLDNHDVQRAMNKLLGKKLNEPLVIDGMLGTKSNSAANLVDKELGLSDKGAFSAWFRRVLAGATVKIEEVS
jgi:hypothetical protein